MEDFRYNHEEFIKQRIINRKLFDICENFKRKTNVNKNYIEYISALLYIKYVRKFKENINVDFEKIYIERKNFYIAETINKEIENLRKELKNGYLFSNIDFRNIVLYREIGEDSVLGEIIEEIYFLESREDYENNNMSIIAKAYEYILQENVIEGDIIKTQSEFYTPYYITSMMSNMIIQKYSQSVFDPCSGSGNFLLSANENKKLETIGVEKNISIYNICMTNLLLNGIDNDKIICHQDKFDEDKFDQNLKYDVILSNPPFSQKNWYEGMKDKDKSYIYHMGLSKTAVADYAYVLTMLNKLSDNGKMAVILPHGVLFRENEAKVRENLVQKNYIDAIIGLPENIFYSTRISVIIMILSKSKKDDKILFIDASKKYVYVRRNISIPENIQNHIIDTYKNRENIDNYSYLASKEEIANNQYNLTIKRYIKEPATEKIKIKKQRIIKELEKLEDEKDILEENIKDVLEVLGVQEFFIKDEADDEEKEEASKEIKIAQIDYEEIGRNIKKARINTGYTQESLAERMNTSVAYISRIENGKTHVTLKRLFEICNILSVPIERNFLSHWHLFKFDMQRR